MKIEIKNIRKQDYKKAIQFAVKGMHFDWYLDSKFLLNAYGRYFWYLEINRATQIFAAYTAGEFAGVLLAEMYEEEKKQNNCLMHWKKEKREKLFICIQMMLVPTSFMSIGDLKEKKKRILF